MKIETDLQGEIEVPKEIADKIHDDSCVEDYEVVYDFLVKCNGEIVDKEIAEFLCAYETNIIPPAGGYPTNEEFVFEDNGFRYTILAFGWLNEKYDRLYMIGYKEGY